MSPGVVGLELWAHQKEAILRAKMSDNFALFFDAGTGKTCTAIRILADKINAKKRILRTLVLAPPVVLTNWKREFARFSQIDAWDIQVLTGPGKQRVKDLKRRKAKIYITNYESLLMLDLFKEIQDFDPEVIIFDEVHRAKNPQAVRTKKAILLADRAKHKLILTGTPILNTLMDLFAQFRIMDGGKSLGKNFFVFRAQYFYDRNAGMPKHMHFPDWSPLPNAAERLNAIIKQTGMVAKKSDCLDLPPLVKKTIEVELSRPQRMAYETMKKDFITYFEDKAAVAQLAITKALRLQQIISGFVTTDTGDDHIFEDNPRLAALKGILENILETSDEKVIIWCVFKKNYQHVGQVCKDLGVDYVELHGEVSPKQRQESIDRFNEDKKTRVLIGHPGSGGIGISLTSASYAIYYSRGFSLEHQIQSAARNYRGGSERHKSITHIDLVAINTLDELILRSLANKEQISAEVLGRFLKVK